MKYPCDECLKYPICRNKTFVICCDLFNYLVETGDFDIEKNERFPNAIDILFDYNNSPVGEDWP
jgi:hypothetical protein